MDVGLAPVSILPAILLAFVLGVVDASFGMGYGTALTPILLLLGLDPLQVVPAVLVSQLVGDFAAAFFHHELGNVDLSPGNRNFRVSMILAGLSSVGSVISVLLAVNLSKLFLNLYIGILVSAIGLLVLATTNKRLVFSWSRLLLLGFLAAFNKGISGGGYGPVVTAGQVVTGMEVRGAIGVTALAEGVTCIVAVLSYVLMARSIDWPLSLWLSVGVTFSAPVSAYVVRRIESKTLRIVMGILTLLLGLSTIVKSL